MMALELLDALAELTLTPAEQGLTREVYTPLYAEAVALVEAAMRDAGLETRVDAAGNLFGRLAGADPDAPVVLTGSHIDTTLNAGRYDGTVGVVGAIEALRTLRGSAPQRSIEVVAIAGEEPRFGLGCLGSRALIGALSAAQLDSLADRDGTTLREALTAYGLDPARLPDAALALGSVHAFLELHIEQGPVLERVAVPIGVVTGIAAPHDVRLTVRGTAGHAGATPMTHRRDALLGAAEIALAAERLANASSSPSVVATTGVLHVHPGAVNVIPGEVVLEVDVRDRVVEDREQVVAELLSVARETCARRGLELDVETLVEDEPVTCAPLVVDAVRAAAQIAGQHTVDLVSGAFHDAMILAAVAPVGMVFVPSRGGISHHPAEHTDPEDLDAGVAVLTQALARLAAS